MEHFGAANAARPFRRVYSPALAQIINIKNNYFLFSTIGLWIVYVAARSQKLYNISLRRIVQMAERPCAECPCAGAVFGFAMNCTLKLTVYTID